MLFKNCNDYLEINLIILVDNDISEFGHPLHPLAKVLVNDIVLVEDFEGIRVGFG
jgi:hypothetical protein